MLLAFPVIIDSYQQYLARKVFEHFWVVTILNLVKGGLLGVVPLYFNFIHSRIS